MLNCILKLDKAQLNGILGHCYLSDKLITWSLCQCTQKNKHSLNSAIAISVGVLTKQNRMFVDLKCYIDSPNRIRMCKLNRTRIVLKCAFAAELLNGHLKYCERHFYRHATVCFLQMGSKNYIKSVSNSASKKVNQITTKYNCIMNGGQLFGRQCFVSMVTSLCARRNVMFLLNT